MTVTISSCEHLGKSSQSSDSDMEFWDTPFYQKEQDMKEQQRWWFP